MSLVLIALLPIGTQAGDVVDEDAARQHWAFQELSAPKVPSNSEWARTPIDAFLLRRMREHGLEPAVDASKSTWLRRVYLDVIGLPPSPKEQQAFLEDTSPEAYEKVADDLLGREGYGERWGRHWLDVARYAETKGYERDETMPHTWRYRDWVIEALNQDVPFDRFLTWQLAGDEIEAPHDASQTATMFLSVGPFDTIVQNGQRARYDSLDDVIATVSQSFLGLTVQCARCHDHKFEPISQVDYYRVLAAFNVLRIPAGARDVGNDAEREKHRKQLEEYDAKFAKTRSEFDVFRADLLAPRYEAGELRKNRKPRVKEKERDLVLAALRAEFSARSKEQSDILRRFERQIRDDARDSANSLSKDEAERKREFQRLESLIAQHDKGRPSPPKAWIFGPAGRRDTHLLIRGEEGSKGQKVSFGLPSVLSSNSSADTEVPSEPAGRRLWLAEWMTKGAGRGLVARVAVNRVWQYHFGQGFVENANNLGLSGGVPSHPELLEWLAADFVAGGWSLKKLHRQIILSSVFRQSISNSKATKDVDNRWLARWPLRRLSSEAIRDSVLAASGSLNRKMGGPSFFPAIEGLINGASAGNNWGRSSNEEAGRRSVYVFAKRAFQPLELQSLDQPDASSSCDQRDVSTTAIQSLLLFNGRFTWNQAKVLAERVEREAEGELLSKVELAFRLTLCREPSDKEREFAMSFMGGRKDDAEALAAFCLVLFNTSEFIYAG